MNDFNSIYAEYYKNDSLGLYKFNDKNPQLKMRLYYINSLSTPYMTNKIP